MTWLRVGLLETSLSIVVSKLHCEYADRTMRWAYRTDGAVAVAEERLISLPSPWPTRAPPRTPPWAP